MGSSWLLCGLKMRGVKERKSENHHGGGWDLDQVCQGEQNKIPRMNIIGAFSSTNDVQDPVGSMKESNDPMTYRIW